MISDDRDHGFVLNAGDMFHFVSCSAAFKAKGSDEAHWCFFVKDGNSKFLAFRYEFMSVIFFVYADSKCWWICGDLHKRVSDLSICFFVMF